MLNVSIPRFIPTCVGNAELSSRHHWQKSVHPHVCGERHTDAPGATLGRGSSPRVWGTLYVLCVRFYVKRFIPTCVGNAGFTMTDPYEYPVHPHVCGERNGAKKSAMMISGSSPRVWGTLFVFARRRWYRRFIPTCVGNATSCPGATGLISVHPHVCGERSIFHQSKMPLVGSSPRVWGTQIRRPTT